MQRRAPGSACPPLNRQQQGGPAQLLQTAVRRRDAEPDNGSQQQDTPPHRQIRALQGAQSLHGMAGDNGQNSTLASREKPQKKSNKERQAARQAMDEKTQPGCCTARSDHPEQGAHATIHGRRQGIQLIPCNTKHLPEPCSVSAGFV
jgi:hypothetical protein